MSSKQTIDVLIDSSVGASSTDVYESPIIPSGKTVRILSFGGMDPLVGDGIGSIIALQWGKNGAWKSIRAISGCTIEFDLKKDFIGDGEKKFRLIRMNKSNSSKVIGAWIDGVILEV